MPGLPARVQAAVDVFSRLTGLKIEPAAPVPSSATTFNWLAAHGAPAVGWAEVVVVVEVVVEEVLVVEIGGASVVEVVAMAGLVVVVVVVVF
jgi:hypothetical protein